MSEEEFDNKSVKDTMDIIINAGDARAFIAEALDDVGILIMKKQKKI
jgi:hypothetical protein